MTALITRDELRAAIDAGAVTVVDALGGAYWEKQHLPGAVPLVEADVVQRAAELLPDRTAAIAVYCSNPACGNSQAVAAALHRLGYTDVRKYREGIEDWVAAGLATETGPVGERPAVRRLDGVAVPTAGTWRIDPGHAEVAFIGRHFMITKVRGRFTGVDGAVVIAEDPNRSAVQVTIDMASVESGDTTRDDHLRSADLFDVEKYPTATFTSTEVRWRGSEGAVTGDLTIHGVTRSVTLAAAFSGHVRDPWGKDRAVFSATTTVNREDFGLTWNMVLDSGSLLVSREIALEIEVETVLEG
ncbi:MAG TPA: YceI family protein [Actinocatenispora sp.]